MIDKRYYVKIVPEDGEIVHRFSVQRRHLAAAIASIALIVASVLVFAGLQVYRAQASVANLKAQSVRQRTQLETIDHQTNALRDQLQHLQRQNGEIRQLIGAPTPHPTAKTKLSWAGKAATIDAVAAHVDALKASSAEAARESDRIKTLALRVLNLRHLRTLAQARIVAAIPSIDPVDGAEVIGCFCYRTYPDAEFHEGVDLGADYGDTVRAAAAGIIASAGYDGAYGIKIDIDHGNGYHTWYAHLSRVDVSVGQQVYKGENIAAVGATGFATGPHLHYQLMYDGQPIDPTPFLHGVPPDVLRTHGLASLP
jgi:murein DD-endopeptidase MepM/ murein hydrolase activator NlpD